MPQPFKCLNGGGRKRAHLGSGKRFVEVPRLSDPDDNGGEQRTGEAKAQGGLRAGSVLRSERVQCRLGTRLFRGILCIGRDGDLAAMALARGEVPGGKSQDAD